MEQITSGITALYFLYRSYRKKKNDCDLDVELRFNFKCRSSTMKPVRLLESETKNYTITGMRQPEINFYYSISMVSIITEIIITL